MNEQQLERLRSLSERVHETFTELADLEDNHLALVEEYRQAKEKLILAIDDAYGQGVVQGKNERERDAHLRSMLPGEHNEVLRLETMFRAAERLTRRKRTDAERLALQVQLARMTMDALRNFEEAKAVVE